MFKPPLTLGLLLVVSLLLAACSSESGPTSFQVSTQAGTGGSLSPEQQTVSPDSSTQFQIGTEPGYQIASVSGCGGSLSGSRYTTGPITSDCSVRAQFELIEYQITTQVENGQVSPETATATFGETVEFSLTPGQGYRLEGTQVSGCRGELQGDTYVAGPIESDCTLSVSFAPIASSVSGRISPAAATAVDSDINDARAQPQDNSTLDSAQLINNLVTLQGFVVFNADGENPGTGGESAFENFANTNDEDDYFLTYLQAGQVIRLEIADFDPLAPENSDLDLYLFDAVGNVVAFSDGFESDTEELVVPTTAQYRVNVYAFSGGSRYLLKLLAPKTNSSQAGPSADFVPDEMIVKLKPHSQLLLSSGMSGQLDLANVRPDRASLVPIERGQLAPQSEQKQKTKTGLSRAMAVLRDKNPEAYRKVMTLREIKQMARQPGVEYAEPNYIRQTLRTPNDPLYTNQWHYRRIDLPLAWEISTGQEADRQPVIVAVVDTGVVLAHPDLSTQLISGYDFISDAERALDGDGIDDNPDDPGDSTTLGESSWHGTHVAGTVAAASDNGIGGTGVSWGARIMPLRALGKNGGTSFDIIQSVLYAAGIENFYGLSAEQPADIINLSLGGPSASQSERDAYQQVRDRGVILIAAAGNENSDAPSYPAAYDSVFSVSATDANNNRAPYSNFGETIALAAPGGNLARDANGDGEADGVLSTVARKDSQGNREPRYALYQGTSMAAPHVAGVVALMKAVHPPLDSEIFELLLVNGDLTDDIGTSGRDDLYGYGLIDALKAVQRAEALAADGQLPDWPPLVTTDPESLNLVDTSEASVTLTNEGGGEPSVTDARTDVNWLSVTLESAGSTPELGTYVVNADRSELGAGFYRGRVIFTLDDGSEVELPVFLQQGGASTEGEMPPIYVLLLDSENADGEAIAQANAQPASDGNDMIYVFEAVPPGRYYLQAGSDLDADNFICQPGESCGIYPILERRQRIEVVDQDLTGLDFVAHILGSATDGSNDQTQAAKTSR